MASSKKSPAKRSTAKTPAKKGARVRGGSEAHVSQIDAGWFYIHQNGLEVGQVVVVGTQASSTEYYFLYESGYGSGQGAYTWPGPNASPVTSKYTYSGTLPSGWSSPSKYQSGLDPIVSKLVTADCTSSALKTPRPRAKKKSAATKRKASR